MPHSPLAGLDDKYEVLAKLREGGMGAVYKVRHRLLEETRVIKVIRPHLEADEELRRRFLREARAAVRLRHPNIAQIYDFTVDEDGSALMVLEFIDGRDLAELLRLRGRLSVELVLEVGVQCAKALSYLHRNEFVHRDISPDNIMLAQDVEGQPLVKLIDLGIAKPLGGSLDLTGTGLFLGKIRYASPEQFRGGGLDRRSDLYSLGVALYELATGRHPIAGDTSEAILAGHLYHPPRPFAESDPGGAVPEPLRRALLRALAKKPEDRFPDAAALGETLGEIQATWTEPNLEATLLERTLIAPRADEPTLVAEQKPADPAARLAELRQRIDELLREGRLVDAEAAAAGAGEDLDAEAVAALRSRLAGLRAEVDAALAEARARRAAGDLAAAGAALGRVRAVEPGNPEAAAIEAQIEAAVERGRRQAEEERARIRDLLDAGDLPAARRELARATAVHGRTELFAQMERRIAEREAAERARAAAAAELGARVDELLADARPASAEAEVGRARARHGEHPEFEALSRRAGERRREAADRLAEADALLAAGDVAAAGAAVDEALALDRELPQALQLHARIELERERRRLGLAEAAARVESEIRAGELAAAERLLAAAESAFGEVAPLAGLRVRLAEAAALRRERAARRAAAVAEVERLLAAGDLDEAQRGLFAAEAEHGPGEDLAALRARLAAERERRLAGRRAAVAEVERLLAAGDLAAAQAALDAAAASAGAGEDLAGLRARLERERERHREAAARAEAEEERRGRRQRVGALLRRAREFADHEDFAAAAAALAEAQELEPGDPAIAALAEQVESSRERAAMFPEGPQANVGERMWERRSSRWPLLAAGAAGLVAVAIAGALWLQPDPPPPDDEIATVAQPTGPEVLRQALAGVDLGRFRALVVGNNAYRGLPRLDSAVPDARSLAATLEERYGFAVELLVDASRDETLRAIERAAAAAGPGDNLLLFYAGHGFVDQVNGRGYWQPVDAEPASTANWISSVEITELLADSAARRVLVIADSCFSGALVERELASDGAAKDRAGAIRERAGRRARLAITSGALQPVLDAGGGGHSVFSGALLEALAAAEPLDARGLFARLDARVRPVAAGLGGEQTPQLGALETDGGGGFFLVPGGAL